MKRLHAWAELVYEWHRFRELLIQAEENGALERRSANEACDTLYTVHCSLMDGMPVR